MFSFFGGNSLSFDRFYLSRFREARKIMPCVAAYPWWDKFSYMIVWAGALRKRQGMSPER